MDLRTPSPTLEPDDAFVAQLSARAVAGVRPEPVARPVSTWRVGFAAAAVALVLVGVAWAAGLRPGTTNTAPPARPVETPSPTLTVDEGGTDSLQPGAGGHAAAPRAPGSTEREPRGEGRGGSPGTAPWTVPATGPGHSQGESPGHSQGESPGHSPGSDQGDHQGDHPGTGPGSGQGASPGKQPGGPPTAADDGRGVRAHGPGHGQGKGPDKAKDKDKDRGHGPGHAPGHAQGTGPEKPRQHPHESTPGR